jgi:hypothetical protein
MNTFNKKSLYVALAGLGVTGAAQAVNINQDGLGQALVYPYYTTQPILAGVAPNNSLLSVVNSTNTAKVVKVRFLEGKASKEVLDFNLWLSAHDVWTTAIIPSGTGAGIFTVDKSCTTPTVSNSSAAPTNFVNYAFTGSNADPLPGTLDRTKEGYVEIIEMGELTGATATAITHVAGTPPGCATLPTTTQPTDLVAGHGGLFGSMTIVNVLAGTDVTSDPTPLANFTARTLWAPAGSTQPDLSQVNPPTSVVFNNTATGSQVVTTDWAPSTNTVDAVSAVLMRDNVYNEFVLDAATKSGTDWVVTFPTKHFYYGLPNPTVVAVSKLFQRNLTAVGACDDVLITQYNREEATVQSSTSFSPPPPTQTDSVCWEANVITFNNTAVLGSVNQSNISTTFSNGWVSINFATTPIHQLTVSGGNGTNTATINVVSGAITSVNRAAATYIGLPTIGFAVQTFNNGTIPGASGLIQSSYGGDFGHKYTRNIQ